MTSSLIENMDRILDRFDDAWNGPTPPRIEDYLRAAQLDQRRTLLVELVRIDMERRINAGEAVRLEETYLRPFSALNDNREALLSLAAREFELRRRREPNLSLNEYLERWPQFREELKSLFAVQPTLSIVNEGTRDGQPPVDEAMREIFALLAAPQTPEELGRLGEYRLLKLLGSGGMGVVFLAEDTALKRLVALKVMRSGLAANGQARQRFVREAQAMAALKHEGIVTIYQVGEDRGVPFLAMEYLQGETLHERLRREKTLPLAEALRIGGALADGLSAAHARGLVHRDIKPANIWLESEPSSSAHGLSRVKLLDFGLARSSGDDDGHLTQTGVILGTPAFLSPEQARGEKVDARSDLFSLGCVLYRTVTGQLPFQGRDMMSSLLSLANDHPKPPRELNPQIPLSLNHLIQRLLAKSAADRPSSAETVAKMLRTLDLHNATIPQPPPAPQPPPTPPRRRRMPKALVALALCGLIALLGAIVIRIRSKDGRETTIEVPEGSAVTIEEKGKVVVLPAAAPSPNSDQAEPSRDRKGAEPPAAPLAEGTEPLGTYALVRQPARLKGVRSWTIETRSLRGGPITCAMRPDGKQLAVGGFDGVVRLYDPSNGRLQQALYGLQKDNRVISLAWSPDGKRLASCRPFGTLDILNAITGQIVCSIPPNSGQNCCVAWSPDGKLLAFGTTGGITLWDSDSGKQISFQVQMEGYPVVLAWSKDSKMLAAGGGRRNSFGCGKYLRASCCASWRDSKTILSP